MTTLASTAPALLETTALPASTTTLPASTTLPESTVLPPEPVCAIGFIWVVELASCLQVQGGVQPRSGFRKCMDGFFLYYKYNQCVRKKYKPKQTNGPIRTYFKSTTAAYVAPLPRIKTPQPYTGRWYSYGENLATTIGFFDKK